jgi:hypothetical protein
MGEGLGWGWPLNLRRDTLGDVVRIFIGLAVAHPHDPVALHIQPSVAFGVMQLCLRQVMATAIHFYNDLCIVMGEVGDVAADRSLSADVQVQRSQSFPQSLLADGHVSAQPSSAADRAGCVDWL